MARSEGWYGIGVNASGELVSMSLDKYDLDVISLMNYGLVHFSEEFQSKGVEMFPDDSEDDIYDDLPSLDDGVTVRDDFENGAKITGKESEPSAEEVAKATKLVKEVFADLGLDYDAYVRGDVKNG